ncbi:MAG: UbiH/UbiF/VisC/COQ6 family ubiquinone biosynthesis hydroxylase [Rhodovibrionaceae bacterium]
MAGGTTMNAEVLVVGGGMIGMTLAAALARGGLETLAIDRQPPASVTGAAFDGRSSAIARGSQRVFEALGLWDSFAAAAQPILDIRVSDGKLGGGVSGLFLHYDYREGAAEDDAAPPMGHIVENRALRQGLAQAVPRDGLTVLAPAELTALERGPRGVAAELADGRRISARLAISAEGRGARLRQEAGIKTFGWSYPQVGIVGTISHEAPHHGLAHEHFLPAGPFAVLPMVDDAEGVHRSSIVWTERADIAPAMMALDEENFNAEMQRRFGGSLGKLALYGGRRWAYPLSMQQAERYIDERLALIGDAAHVIHPIAGQGLNLGLRDVAALAECLVDAHRLGLDPGDALALERYQRWRRFDNFSLMAVTDGLNRLYSNDLPPVRLARDLGMAAVDRLPGLKRFFMGHAMGLAGDLPRLIRGEAL